jgi:simple sugar transport system permease protein
LTVAQLDARFERDLERGLTGAGPHLHDVSLEAASRDLRSFGSQGEQRMAVLALVLAEAEVLRSRTGSSPLVLLDDVLSELDEDRRRALAEIVAGGVVLSWSSGTKLTVASLSGPLAILAACFCWAMDNNLTRKLSAADPVQIAAVKGLVAGATNTAIAMWLGALTSDATTMLLAGGLGLASYGVSLVLFVLALRQLGAARTGAYFSSAPFIGAALAVAFALRAGLFNIGVEGQLLIGATAAAWVGTWHYFGDAPAIIAVLAVLLAGVIGGGLYGAVPGFLKARLGAHEVITTIMLNAIAVLYVRWMVSSSDPLILRDPAASVPRTRPLPASARLPTLVHSEPPLHLGFFIMLSLCVLVWFVLQRMTTGFEIRMVGANPHAARYAGIRVGRVIVLVMTLAGGFAGLAGAGEVAGTAGFLLPGAFAALGFDAIAIALLARANPFAIVPAAFLWGSMLAGAPLMQQETGLSIDLVRIVQALVLLASFTCVALNLLADLLYGVVDPRITRLAGAR